MADKRISQLVDRGTVANNDVVPIVVSGATTTNKATISSIQTFMQGNLDLGVTSVGITLGSSGTDVSVSGSPITSSGNITINLPTASATNRGLLSAADWVTFNSKQDAGSFVTLDTTQTITAQKTFTTSGSSDTMIISHGSGSGFALDVLKAGNGEAIRVTKSSGTGNAMTISGGNFEAGTIVKTGGTSSQFLKADGSVDSSTYLTTGSAGSTYVPYSGAAASVNLGVYSITANAINSAGSGSTAGQINLRSDAFFSLVNGYGSIASGTTNQFNLYQTTGAGVFRGAILSLNSITASATRTYTLPDADGTLALSTDLGAYLPLTGGTLTGALNGTSASLSSNLIVGSGSTSTSKLTILATTGVAAPGSPTLGIYDTSAPTFGFDFSLEGVATGDLYLNRLVSGTRTPVLQIARATGAATFSSSVMAESGSNFVGTSVNTRILVTASGVANTVVGFNNSGSTTTGVTNNTAYLGVLQAYPLVFTTDSIERLRIAPNGNVGIGTASPTTFSGNTTVSINNPAGGAVLELQSNGTSALRLGCSTSDAALWEPRNVPVLFGTNNTERMRITSGGYLKASNTGNYGFTSATGPHYDFFSNDASNTVMHMASSNTSYSGVVLATGCGRTANAAYSLFRGYSGNGTLSLFDDKEFDLYGDGNGKCDGSWTGGGADYAEYFEWADGNPNNEDRRGLSVSLIDNKIKIAKKGENIIGVISGNPSMVGDAAWNKWSGKHLKDDFGSYILDEEGNRTLNPNYNPDEEYIPREKRREWSVVGLLGKLRIIKGQETMPTWIKMRDVSENVEEWLIK